MDMNRSIIIIGVVLVTLLTYQNCSKVDFGVTSDQSLVPLCRDIQAPEVAPKLKWDWRAQLANSVDARFPTFDQVMASPMVADLDGDGFPEVVFVAFSKSDADLALDAFGDKYVANGVVRIVDGRTGQTKRSFADGIYSPFGSQSPLLADIDGDGKIEILFLSYTRKVNGVAVPQFLVALNADGTLRWTYQLSQSNSIIATGITATDINGDGIPEVLAAGTVIGEVAGRPEKLLTLKSDRVATSGLFVSLNPSHLDQKSIITHLGVYGTDGTEKFKFANKHFSQAVADFFPDVPGVEIIAMSSPYLEVINGLTGDVIKRADLSLYNDLQCSAGRIGGGPASIGDFDGDPKTLEIAIATGRHLTIFDQNLVPKFKFVTQDCSSLVTGVTSFDFNGDGKAEILYSDEEYLRIYEINKGILEEKYKLINPSGTLYEYPVVADIDGSGSASLLVAANNFNVSVFYKGVDELQDAVEASRITGVRAFESSVERSWMPTRPIWNQYNFHPDFFTDSGRLSLDPLWNFSYFRRNNQGQGSNLGCRLNP